MNSRLTALLALSGASLLAFAANPTTSEKLVIHEWGTFTSLQDETGRNLTGINSDDEPVPSFVHRLAPNFYLSQLSPRMTKGVATYAPDVTMRLETPVVYFHPPTGSREQSLDLSVQFRGGWLTEYYPLANVKAPGYDPRIVKGPAGRITGETIGELTWKNLRLGADGELPKTDAPVWLAPRAVQAANVRAENGQTEKYLFYRGLGNLTPPLRIIRDAQADTLSVYDERDLAIPAGWLVSIRPDGTLAFKRTGRMPEKGLRATLPANFRVSEYAPKNLDDLRAEMKAALTADGLFSDEAEAMLNTWQAAYFKSPGLRFFYLCPKPEIDSILPMTVSVPAQIDRVMVGRIELVTPEQRTLLSKVATTPMPASRGEKDTQQEKEAIQKAYLNRWQTMQRLGRFSHALLLDEVTRRPTAPLQAVVDQFTVAKAQAPIPAVAK